MKRAATAMPTPLARAPLRVVRPRDAQHVYAHPRAEFARLTARGALHRLAPGYYAVVPQEYVGDEWSPTLEAAAAGIAAAHVGADHVVLMGLSAARLHGALPRALAVAVVAVPLQRRAIQLVDRH
ncbi:MAG TPA: hypothetical protein VG708_10810, partial [Mycobacteriales bacterium]|nr:hypothetical protein [Mycobacteriales bacterium]